MNRPIRCAWVAGLLLAVAGCRSAQPKRFEPIPPRHEPQPAATQQPQPRAVAESHAAGPPASQPPLSSTPPSPPPAPPPAYVAVLEPVDPTDGTAVHTIVEAPDRVRLRTRNIRRLSITRHGSPLVRDRSVVLRIDTQVFEWLPRYTALELTRSENGIWRITRHSPPKRP